MTKAYIVFVESKLDGNRVSSEAYKTLREAQRFIENRSDRPQKQTEYTYRGGGYNFYTIYDINIID